MRCRNVIFIIGMMLIFQLHGQENFVVDWDTGKIYSSATVSIPTTYDYAQRRLAALESAKESARVNYYRALRSIKLADGEDTLYTYFDDLEKQKTQLFSLLENTKLLKLEYPDLNTIKVTYYLDIYGQKESLMSIVMGDTKHYTEDLEPYMGYNYENNFSGIVIDARGELTSFNGYTVKVEPALFVSVRDSDGNLVFNRYNVLADAILEKGMVHYTYDVNKKTDRVGNNPLHMVACGAGNRAGSVIVVSVADAKRMLSSQSTRDAIKYGRIEIIINR